MKFIQRRFLMAGPTVEKIKATASEKIKATSSALAERSPYVEGEITKRVEEQTAKIPSIGYLGLAVGSMALSAGLALFAPRKEFANFVGLWAPSFMLMGIYNKLVKLEGSDAFSQPTRAYRSSGASSLSSV